MSLTALSGGGRTTALLVAALASAAAADAQSVAQLSVAGGVATDTRGIRSGAVSVSPSITLGTGTGWLSTGGTLARFANGGSTLAGRVALGGRTAVAGPVGFALTGAAGLTGASYGARFTELEALPVIELRRGTVFAFAGARGAMSTSSLPRTSGLLGARAGRADTSRSVIAPVLGVGLSGAPAGERGLLDLSYQEERAAIAGRRATDRTLALSLRRAGHLVSISGGSRSGSGEAERYGAATAEVAMGGNVRLQLGAGRYARNRLTGMPGGTFASAGLTFSVGRAAAPIATRGPVPRGVPAPAAGMTRVAITAPRALRVELAGDWNGWQAVPARRAPNGVWYADLALAPGRYRYAFRVDGSRWTVPDGVDAEDDDFGGKSAWLTVQPAQ